jgi:hypothetical protein
MTMAVKTATRLMMERITILLTLCFNAPDGFSIKPHRQMQIHFLPDPRAVN